MCVSILSRASYLIDPALPTDLYRSLRRCCRSCRENELVACVGWSNIGLNHGAGPGTKFSTLRTMQPRSHVRFILSIQWYFAYRLHKLTGHCAVPIACAALSLVQLACYFAASIHRFVHHYQTPPWKRCFSASGILSICADLLLAGTLSVNLWKRRSSGSDLGRLQQTTMYCPFFSVSVYLHANSLSLRLPKVVDQVFIISIREPTFKRRKGD